MKFINNVDEDKFNDFVKQNSSNFMQTSYFGKINQAKGLKYFLVGLEDNGKLVATAMILEKHLISNYNYLYIPRGFIANFNDFNLLKTFTDYLKDFGKKKKAIFIAIDPEIILSIDDNKFNQDLIINFKKLNFNHLGFNYYFENRQPRYTYCLDLKENLSDNFHSTTKKIYNRGNIYNIEIVKGDINDISSFHNLMLETGNRNQAVFFSQDYYQNFYQIFHEQNMSDLYLAKVNIPNLISIYENKIKEIKMNLAKIKKESKKNDLNEQLLKYQKELTEIKEIKEEEVILSSIITVKFNDKVWTVHGGNSNKLRFLNANYWLYFKIIDDAFNDGYKKIDFFGTIGKEDKNNHEYGIHLFKKRLGGNKIEYIGEFDLVLNKLIYFLYKKVYNKIRYRKKS